MRGFWLRMFSRPWTVNVVFCRCLEGDQKEIKYNHWMPRRNIYCRQLERPFSVSTINKYELIPKVNIDSEVDLKKDAVAIFHAAIRAVGPRVMIQKMLQYNEETSELTVEGKIYNMNNNVFVVGFGTTVLGMARVVEDILAPHVVKGIIVIPRGLHKKIKDMQLDEMLLSQNTKIQVYEGAHKNEADEASHEAAEAIHNLVRKLTSRDLFIVLCSGGGSALCPLPYPPITLQELRGFIQLLKANGASTTELNILRKNIEVLKGGGLALEAKPAKVLSLIMSSIVGNSVDMIASGPTCPTQPTPHHCIEIMNRLRIMDQTPENVRRFLEKECKKLDADEAKSFPDLMNEKAKYDAEWQHVQNVTVGNNSMACEAAAGKAAELGYVPLILMTDLAGEARNVGYMCAKLAKFIMLCFDRKASFEPNKELAILETTLVAKGITKTLINGITNKVAMALNSNRDVCIIAGGSMFVNVQGTGIGGKNMETALAVAVQMNEEFRLNQMHMAESRMCFLSVDSDGHDGITKMAGAVVDQDFLQEVVKSGLDMKQYLFNNDSFTFFSQINGGKNLVTTEPTGTNVMDIMIMLVQRPKD